MFKQEKYVVLFKKTLYRFLTVYMSSYTRLERIKPLGFRLVVIWAQSVYMSTYTLSIIYKHVTYNDVKKRRFLEMFISNMYLCIYPKTK